MKPFACGQLLWRLADLMEAHADELAEIESLDNGKPVTVARAGDVQVVKRSDAGTFVVLPGRWIVERTAAWLNRCRRSGKDWEDLN